MRTILLTFFATAIASSAYAQEADKVLIRVKYAFSHMHDIHNRENYYKETMVLIAGKKASVYLSYDKVLQDIQTKEVFEKQTREQANVKTPTFSMPPKKRPTNSMEIFYFADAHKFIIKEHLGAFYLWEEKVEKIDWNITSETRVIENLNCKKAISYFRGRNWTVWFAEELPFSSGPWKLVGLPGLIIEAYDEDSEVSFVFAGLEKMDDNAKPLADEYKYVPRIGSSNALSDTKIQLPTDAHTFKATPEEIKELKDLQKKDPEKFFKTQMELLGLGGLKPVSKGKSSPVPIQMPVFNNPIERSKP